MSNINIQEEAAEFLRLHIYGSCPKHIKVRFSDMINFNDVAKDTLIKVYRHIGKDKDLDLNDEELCLFQKALSKFRCNISVPEIELYQSQYKLVQLSQRGFRLV